MNKTPRKIMPNSLEKDRGLARAGSSPPKPIKGKWGLKTLRASAHKTETSNPQ